MYMMCTHVYVRAGFLGTSKGVPPILQNTSSSYGASGTVSILYMWATYFDFENTVCTWKTKLLWQQDSLPDEPWMSRPLHERELWERSIPGAHAALHTLKVSGSQRVSDLLRGISKYHSYYLLCSSLFFYIFTFFILNFKHIYLKN